MIVGESDFVGFASFVGLLEGMQHFIDVNVDLWSGAVYPHVLIQQHLEVMMKFEVRILHILE
jgi:hypothetical protein